VEGGTCRALYLAEEQEETKRGQRISLGKFWKRNRTLLQERLKRFQQQQVCHIQQRSPLREIQRGKRGTQGPREKKRRGEVVFQVLSISLLEKVEAC